MMKADDNFDTDEPSNKHGESMMDPITTTTGEDIVILDSVKDLTTCITPIMTRAESNAHSEDDDNQHQNGDDSFQNEHNDAPTPPSWIRSWIPHCCRRPFSSTTSGPTSESTGLALDFYARGHILMSSLFLGPALLDLAQAAADARCQEERGDLDQTLRLQQEDGNSSYCKVYGFQPSSLLANIAIVSGFLGSLSMPFVGAIIDHTPYRRHVGAISAIALSLLKGFEVIIGKHTWFLVAVLQVVTGILYNIHATTAYAYTSELTCDPNEQAKFNSSYNVVLYVSMLAFLMQIFGASYIWRTDDLVTARISQIITCTISMICFVVAWKYFFHNRPALSHVPEGGSLLSCGFTKVWKTSCRIVRHYRALTWAILAIMFGEAAVSGFATIATTYLRVVLQMSSTEIGLVFLVVFIMGIPGSCLGGMVTVRLKNPVSSAIICDLGCIVVTSFASVVLTGPEHKGLPALLFSAVWGIGLGWLPPVDTTLFMNLMPTDSRVELMGLMMLAAVVLSWLPPMVFSLLNELGLSMAWGLVSLNIYFILSIVCLAQIGNYNSALNEAMFTPAETSSSSLTTATGRERDITVTILNDDREENLYDRFRPVNIDDDDTPAEDDDDNCDPTNDEEDIAHRIRERRNARRIDI
ncbi:hypothetical protein ACA910_002927 [Epithemia clementina (nom. ined.)]